MLTNILSGWNFSRIIRLIIGLYLLWDGIMSGVWFLTLLGMVLVVLPLMNIGCCATGNCNTKMRKPLKDVSSEEVIFEEVKED